MMRTAGSTRRGLIPTTSPIQSGLGSNAQRSNDWDESMSWFDQRPDDAMDGAFTVVGPLPVRTCEPAAFREAMSRLGAAVHVITTAGPGGKTGATATAVCSVSDAPPTLLMCLNRRRQTNPVVVENGVFCVNTLGHDGADIAD